MDDREREAVEEGLVFLEERDFPLAAAKLRQLMQREAPSFNPDWASPPGHTIKRMLDEHLTEPEGVAPVLVERGNPEGKSYEMVTPTHNWKGAG